VRRCHFLSLQTLHIALQRMGPICTKLLPVEMSECLERCMLIGSSEMCFVSRSVFEEKRENYRRMLVEQRTTEL
jgi:hypothetical protein